MYPTLIHTFENLSFDLISEDRKSKLQPLIDFIQEKYNANKIININFICTHNSRRSHLAQIWAQTAAEYYQIPQVQCYSGGTEATALFPKVVETLKHHGFLVHRISNTENPVYAVKFDENALPIIGFSKTHNDNFNPTSNFLAVMTCSQADTGCPFISGAEKRVAITYEDPKIADESAEQTQIYHQRSIEISMEMKYVFSKIKK